jgi:hypothetical protein
MNDNIIYMEFRRRLMEAIKYYAEYMRFVPFDGTFPIADGVEIEAHVFQKHSVEDTQPVRTHETH